jgi:phosphatidylglycerophosphate synthase
MKSVNRKILMTLVGVVLAIPFLFMASVVGVHVATLADSVRVEVLCIALALASVAVRIVDGYFARIHKVVSVELGSNERKEDNDLRGASTISPGY